MQKQYTLLTDPQWEVIKEKLPIQRKRKHSLRSVVDAIFWILRTGSQWRNLPATFPDWCVVYYYFRKWKENGLLEGLNTYLNVLIRRQMGREDTPSAVSIDTQSVKKAPFVSQDTGIDVHRGAAISESMAENVTYSQTL